MTQHRIPDDLRAELDATGLPWDIVLKKRHRGVVLGGKLVGILPRSPRLTKGMFDRAYMNLVGQIRRAAREMNP